MIIERLNRMQAPMQVSPEGTSNSIVTTIQTAASWVSWSADFLCKNPEAVLSKTDCEAMGDLVENVAYNISLKLGGEAGKIIFVRMNEIFAKIAVEQGSVYAAHCCVDFLIRSLDAVATGGGLQALSQVPAVKKAKDKAITNGVRLFPLNYVSRPLAYLSLPPIRLAGYCLGFYAGQTAADVWIDGVLGKMVTKKLKALVIAKPTGNIIIDSVRWGWTSVTQLVSSPAKNYLIGSMKSHINQKAKECGMGVPITDSKNRSKTVSGLNTSFGLCYRGMLLMLEISKEAVTTRGNIGCPVFELERRFLSEQEIEIIDLTYDSDKKNQEVELSDEQADEESNDKTDCCLQ